MNNEPEKEIIDKLIYKFKLKHYSEIIEELELLKIKYPRSLFLLNLEGGINNENENYELAINSFNNAIKINKNFADAYYNLGIVYKKINQVEKSIYNYKQCIKIDPKKIEAYNNLGNIYKDKENIEQAIQKYIESLEIKKNNLIALQNFGICLQNFKIPKKSDLVDKHIINLLEENTILRPVDIINSLIHYLYLDSKFKLILEQTDILEDVGSLEKIIKILLDNKILMIILKITPITDLKIENFLRNLRRGILINISSIENKDRALKIMQSIAKQCFINEYIYQLNNDEEKAIKKLQKKISKDLNKSNKNKYSLEISCMAAYKALGLFDWSYKIEDLDIISELIRQQINEPNLEKNLTKKLEYGTIKNSVSLKVKNQYEENPYPRWTKIALNRYPSRPVDYFNNLNLSIDKKKIKDWNNINVLVAGCGTGQHAITTATKYKNSFITAIDLSLKSLSYAKRKSDELGIKNINFIQMDILDLNSLGKKFEIIECVGVLHHMKNPTEGWQSLFKVLNQNGLMMIGLYSEIAREHIKRIRSNIEKLNININEKNIKNFREKIIASNDLDFEIIKQSPDFYTLSSVRDLLFHVQEHRFNIQEIKKNLNHLKLKFCGFENQKTLSLFKKIYGNKKDLYNLDLWHKFEIKNQRTFAGMYQFWCQK